MTGAVGNSLRLVGTELLGMDLPRIIDHRRPVQVWGDEEVSKLSRIAFGATFSRLHDIVQFPRRNIVETIPGAISESAFQARVETIGCSPQQGVKVPRFGTVARDLHDHPLRPSLYMDVLSDPALYTLRRGRVALHDLGVVDPREHPEFSPPPVEGQRSLDDKQALSLSSADRDIRPGVM